MIVSVACILWFTLLSESLKALFPISSSQHPFVIKSFNLKTSFKVSLTAPVYGLLRMLYSNRGVLKHFPNYAQRLFFCLSYCFSDMIY